MKIHILGGPGSGKTTLAEKISQRFSIPHHDLDQWMLKYGNQNEVYVQNAMNLAAQESWVSEGIFLLWTEPFLERADFILLLDIPWQVACWRVLRRHVQKTLRGTNPHPTRLLLPFLRFTRGYYTTPAYPASKEAYLSSFLEALTRQPSPLDAPSLMALQEIFGQDVPLSAAFTRIYLERYAVKLLVLRGSSDYSHLQERLQTHLMGHSPVSPLSE